ncbi:CDC48-like AAA ATPase [Cryptosporidium canis]|uniref:CDC48-like AAA ATPase n=1 Tax=Cryptosporidium canis TaxID=195482 RepID=A0A9D5HXH7_9CRYT|nr:CDC48-like AAA ATPase [Cryptosporidium canis]
MFGLQYIPIIISKVDTVHRFFQANSCQRWHMVNTGGFKIKYFENYYKDLGVNKNLKVLYPHVMLVNCKASNIPIKDFKEFLNKISKYHDNVQSHPKIDEINNNVRINIQLQSGSFAEKIGRFLEIVNENCSRFQNSTVFNNWKIVDDINGKKITIEINTLDNGGIVNIQIPSDKNHPINIEYIKSKNSLYKSDLDAIHFLMKPSNYFDNFKRSNSRDMFINKRSFFSNHVLFDKSVLEKELIGNFERMFDNLNRDIFTEALIDNFNDNCSSIEYNSNSSKQYSNEPNTSYTYSNSDNCSYDNIISSLEDLGVQVYYKPNKNCELASNAWDCLGGYEDVKRQIEEHIMLSLKSPEILDKIVDGTRVHKDSKNRPKLVLFEGPPGTGKTTSARIISNTIDIPLIYVSLENIVSKWYGESENRLAQIFDIAKKFNQGCIIFIDEIDALASSRDKTFSMHEGSKKILSVLLRKLDGFDTMNSKTLLICATNRRKDIDEAFLNRIDSTVIFNLPNESERELIFKQYAKHLTSEERLELSKISKKLSGRSIRQICLEAEREWASMILKKKELQKDEVELPPVEVYKNALKRRVK